MKFVKNKQTDVSFGGSPEAESPKVRGREVWVEEDGTRIFMIFMMCHVNSYIIVSSKMKNTGSNDLVINGNHLDKS